MTEKLDINAVKQAVRNQIVLQNFQTLLSNMVPKCFEKCVIKPGTKLDWSEESCLVRCAERYNDALSTVSATYIGRMKRESGQDS